MSDLRWEDLVTVGTVARAQGRRGEVVVNPLTDEPERFGRLERVLLRRGGTVVPFAIEAYRLHRGRPVLKLAGVSDISSAEALVGHELRIAEDELLPLDDGGYYHFQLAGYEVWDRREGCLGRVEDVLATGGTDLLVVRDRAQREILVPFCRAICRRIDARLRRIETLVPEGLVSLNAN